MNSDELRTTFLKFFEEKGHLILPSSSLIPSGDPTLLLTTAGMVQIKPYFLGEMTPPSRRLASCQKCFRTTDMESVGDGTHLTFFEMLGNFSVGDYFKKEAIAWAWEFFLQRLHLPEEKLWVTIFLDDNEAFRYWREIGVPADKIIRCGEEDNFWGPAGSSGPCGPSSEIHYDFGPERGCGRPECRPNCGCGRFTEIWNLVFTQYNQDETGRRTPLPRPNIDTGMGLERILAVVTGGSTVYDTDLFQPLLQKVVALTGRMYGVNNEDTRAMRVVAEHGRALAFLIADGVIPANEGRGYVLRRVLRRAALFGRRLGLEKPFLSEIARVTVARMGHVYPELEQRQEYIVKMIELEEARFEETLNTGLEIIEDLISQRSVISGEEAFRLYDTYGFPIELTREIARERGVPLDMEGFEKEMARQRERARATHKFDVAGRERRGALPRVEVPPTYFVGYGCLEQAATVLKIVKDGLEIDEVIAGQEADIILDTTPFYGEMGGQVGDTGEITGPDGVFTVLDTLRVAPDIIMHRGKVAQGKLALGQVVRAAVDVERRRDIARNHTATHLLQAALRQVLGEHIQQRGSLVAPDRLRFDFSHPVAMRPEEVRQVQRLVNEKIRLNLRVFDQEVPYREAVRSGAIALFDEKYGDVVRVLKVGEPPVSTELCGGTHVAFTGEIGYFHIISEGSIGAGQRRIEAVTGRGAEEFIEQHLGSLDALARSLETTPDDLPGKVAGLQDELEKTRKLVISLEKELARREAAGLLEKVEKVNGINLIAARLASDSQEVLKEMADYLRDRLGSAIVVLGAVSGGRPVFVATVTPDLIASGYHAGNIIREVAKVTGGGGGGKPGFAQAGGRDKNRLDEALGLVKGIIERGGKH